MIMDSLQSLSKPEGLEQTAVHQQQKAQFALTYDDLLIGWLSLQNGRWTFQYSEAFKEQNDIAPLIGFSAVDRVYESSELWPFFISRIPGVSRPAVQAILAEEGIDERNLAALLARFGRKTIANPFVLEAMAA